MLNYEDYLKHINQAFYHLRQIFGDEVYDAEYIFDRYGLTINVNSDGLNLNPFPIPWEKAEETIERMDQRYAEKCREVEQAKKRIKKLQKDLNKSVENLKTCVDMAAEMVADLTDYKLEDLKVAMGVQAELRKLNGDKCSEFYMRTQNEIDTILLFTKMMTLSGKVFEFKKEEEVN